MQVTAGARKRRPGGLLWHRDFRLLWGGETVSLLGNFMAVVAMPLLAVDTLHASNFAVGVLVAAEFLPWLVIGLPAGAWVDRLPARPVMVTCDLVSVVLYGSVPVSAAAGVLTLGQLMTVALLAGAASVFFNTAYQVYLRALLTPEELVEGNAKLQGSSAAAELAGPGLAGLMAQVLGATAAVLANAASFLVSAACLLAIRHRAPRQPAPQQRPPFRRTIADGIRFVARDPYLSRMTLCMMTGNLSLIGFVAVQVVFLVRVLGLPSAAIGLLVAVQGVGGLLGATVTRRISERIGTARCMLLAVLGFQPFCLLAPMATRGPGLVLYVAGILMTAIAVVICNVLIGSFRQAYSPPGMLGRVSATMKFLTMGTSPLGALAGGVLAATIGPRAALWVLFAALTASGMLLLSRPFIRSRDLPSAPGAAGAAGAANAESGDLAGQAGA
jgi:predicted MFS family arabinose efflux permease